jgi:hypothetical protein
MVRASTGDTDTMNIKRILTTAAVPCFFAALAWVAGYDFDSRGIGPAYLMVLVSFVTVMVWIFPWD